MIRKKKVIISVKIVTYDLCNQILLCEIRSSYNRGNKDSIILKYYILYIYTYIYIYWQNTDLLEVLAASIQRAHVVKEE
jgi:hypothetical protein